MWTVRTAIPREVRLHTNTSEAHRTTDTRYGLHYSPTPTYEGDRRLVSWPSNTLFKSPKDGATDAALVGPTCLSVNEKSGIPG